jgi:hypothetical protein
MNIIKLKGGSLSATYHHVDENIIRKKVSLKTNREYGFVRWYSQMKKIQRYNTIHPDLFPKMLNVSYEENYAYFDIEYKKGFKDLKQIFSERELSIQEIEQINQALWNAFDELHSSVYNANPGAPYLYFKEEVLQKIHDASISSDFKIFYNNHDVYEYNGIMVHSMKNYLNELDSFFKELEFLTEQTIHGNPTLENTLYSFDENRIVFIDPYEESIVDTRFLDYSQVLQCSSSHYGFINDREVQVNDTSVSFKEEIPKNFLMFNEVFRSNIAEKRTREIVDVFEATQFIRMLPFKVRALEHNKAKYFYVHACYLLSKVFK